MCMYIYTFADGTVNYIYKSATSSQTTISEETSAIAHNPSVHSLLAIGKTRRSSYPYVQFQNKG